VPETEAYENRNLSVKAVNQGVSVSILDRVKSNTGEGEFLATSLFSLPNYVAMKIAVNIE
jgi:hypothetical protein